MQSLYNTLQAMVKQTVDAHEPADYILGVVVSRSPLAIQIQQNDVITEEFLILTDAVRDYDVDIEVRHVTELRAGGTGDPAYEAHDHDYIGRKKIRVYNSLHVGETVILLKQAGGQEFVVLSRDKNHKNLTGQWI